MDLSNSFLNSIKLRRVGNNSETSRIFSNSIKNLKHAGNVDDPEGGFDALMQVMKCKKDIGWHKNSRKMIILMTDRYSFFQNLVVLFGYQ